MAYQSFFTLSDVLIAPVLEQMIEEVSNARNLMQVELDKKDIPMEVSEIDNQIIENEVIQSQAFGDKTKKHLDQVIDDSKTKVGKTKIIRAIEELKHKVIVLFANRTGKNNKEFNAKKDSDKYEID